MQLNSRQLLELEQSVSDILIKAGEEIESHWQDVHIASLKDNRDYVTEVDIKTEKYIREQLFEIFPTAGFLVEEGDDNKKEDYNWTIDHIDQTKNFVGKIPLFYTHVALLYKEEPILGVIHNPISKQTISASLNNGTKLNNKIIINNVRDSMKDVILDIDFGGINEQSDWKFDVMKKLINSVYRVRMTGGAFSPYLITSGIDAFIVLNETTKLVDQMPRMIITREFGIMFEEFVLDGHKIYIAGSKNIVGEIKNIFLLKK